jgi:hypothetical protein|tara:strand:+ start:10937 stop:12544 length:1608 start_codon:yes stop_codon:yes gene_type:complete
MDTPAAEQQNQNETARAIYARLEIKRNAVLQRARGASELTLTALIPPAGHSEGEALYSPFQSAGAEGVNNMASKLLLASMQPGQPFFRVAPASEAKAEIEAMEAESPERLELEGLLTDYEANIMADVEDSGDRVVIIEYYKHLIVGGNAVFYQAQDEAARMFPLSQYCVARDPSGNVRTLVIKEIFTCDTLDEDVKAIVVAQGESVEPDDEVPVYTLMRRVGSQFRVVQEVAGVVIPGTEGSYPLDASPYIVGRLIHVSGSSYGGGYVDQYYGDLSSLESLRQALVEGAVAMSKIVFLVRPNGTTDIRTLSEADNGAMREGNADDVSVVQGEKAMDLREAREYSNEIETRLARLFLMDSSVARASERTTATEIRQMTQALEDALGGVYSALTRDFQLPYLVRRIAIMRKAEKLVTLPSQLTRLTIVTGIEALGRGHDRERLMNWIQTLASVTPQYIETDLNVRAFAEKLAIADGIDIKAIQISNETKQVSEQQMKQEQMMQQSIDKLGPNAVAAAGQMVNNANPEGLDPEIMGLQ